eukprot:g46550.t1
MGRLRHVWAVDEGEEVDGVQQQPVQGLSFCPSKIHSIHIVEAAQVVGHRMPGEVWDPGATVKFRLSRGMRRRDSTAHLSILRLVHNVGSKHRSDRRPD